jgi:sterol desaturase/sphingolipid hydroxylase (fatty acid hydroxylase superfamily)
VDAPVPATAERTTRAGKGTVVTFGAAIAFALLVRGGALIGVALLFLVFVPVEKLFALRPQRVFRRGLLTDLTHLLVNNAFVAVATVVLVAVAALPLLWVRRFDVEASLPTAAAVAVAVALVSVGNYWGHRLTHRVPVLWRFHAVHHSIEQMDWVASGRLHPLDSGFTQAFTVLPLFLLGYDAGVFAAATVFITLLALFQHANVRLRFPGLRWVINTPEWHHWHHAIDDDARDTNFGLPVVDKLFGTAHLPRDRRPRGFGIPDPVPQEGYLRHLAYPFTRVASGTGGGDTSPVTPGPTWPATAADWHTPGHASGAPAPLGREGISS